MAAGSHLEKGIWALFVMAAITMAIPTAFGILLPERLNRFQSPSLTRNAIEMMRRASPIRFDRAVIIPAARDLGF